MDTNERDRYIAEHLFGWHINPETHPDNIKRYSADLDAAFQMEQKIAERGMERDYTFALFCLVLDISDADAQRRWINGVNSGNLFKILHATPDQRAQACYEMLKANDK